MFNYLPHRPPPLLIICLVLSEARARPLTPSPTLQVSPSPIQGNTTVAFPLVPVHNAYCEEAKGRRTQRKEMLVLQGSHVAVKLHVVASKE